MGHATSRGPICWNPRRFRLFVPSDNERSMRIRWCNHASDPKRLLPASLYGDLVPAHGEPAEGAEDGNPPDSCGGRAVSLLEIWLKQIYVRIYLYIYIYIIDREREWGLRKGGNVGLLWRSPSSPPAGRFSVFSLQSDVHGDLRAASRKVVQFYLMCLVSNMSSHCEVRPHPFPFFYHACWRFAQSSDRSLQSPAFSVSICYSACGLWSDDSPVSLIRSCRGALLSYCNIFLFMIFIFIWNTMGLTAEQRWHLCLVVVVWWILGCSSLHFEQISWRSECDIGKRNPRWGVYSTVLAQVSSLRRHLSASSPQEADGGERQ